MWLYAAANNEAGLAVILSIHISDRKIVTRNDEPPTLKAAYAVHVEVYLRKSADSDTFTNAGGQKHDLSYNDSATSFIHLRLYSKVEPLSDASEKQFSVVRTHDAVMWRPRATELTLLTLNAKAQFTEFSGNIRAFFRECERTPVAS